MVFGWLGFWGSVADEHGIGVEHVEVQGDVPSTRGELQCYTRCLPVMF